MKSEGGGYTRTKNSIRNSVVAVLFQVIALTIGFFSRKIFIDYLGTEVLGLSSTASSLLGFLNLAELGIGSAIAVTLYKPLFEKDKETIKEIIAMQGWLYRNIALFIIGGSAILMCFFPLIFAKMELPLWYAYVTYSVFLFSSVLGYFVNYKMVLLSADQKEYKIQLGVRIVSISKLILQAISVRFFSQPYIWWISLEFVSAIVNSFVINKIVYKNCPYLKEEVIHPGKLRHKFPDVVTKVKQLMFHKIGGFVLGQTSPIIIYAYTSLTMVALYGNYLIITHNLSLLLVAMFSGLGASVGNMLVEGNRTLILKVFKELFTSRFLAVATCSICTWLLAEPFITVWLGAEYLLDKTTLLMIIVIFYISTMRLVVDTFLNSYGLFRDIWAPIVESILNLGCSIGLGYFYGLHGILGGVIISQVLVVFMWKPYFLFSQGLREPISAYIVLYLKHLVVGGVCYYVVQAIGSLLPVNPTCGVWHFLLYAVIIFSCCLFLLGGMLYVFEPGMRSFLKRMLTVVGLTKETNAS